jgi:hypothetical protein
MFDAVGAIVAGLIGGAVMSALLYMGIAMMPSQMRMNLFLMLGTMLLPVGVAAYVLGAMVHAMMSVAFGLAHAGVYAAGIEPNAWWGLLFGAVHWVAVGIGLAMIPMLHRGMRDGKIEKPGMFALSLGAMTAMGFLLLHLVFGLIVGLVYAAYI